MARRGRLGFLAGTALSCPLLFAAVAAQAVPYRSLQMPGTQVGLERAIGSNTAPRSGPPVDVGASDFTIEMWIKATAANSETDVECGSVESWQDGNILIDRWRNAGPPSWGASISRGVLTFGARSRTNSRTVCGRTRVTDDRWHHAAFEYRRSDGELSVYVDGRRDAIGWVDPDDLSYPDDAYTSANNCVSGCTEDPYLGLGGAKSRPVFQDSYSGLIDEIRFSSVLRYGAGFTPPSKAFTVDGATLALFHLDDVTDMVTPDETGNAADDMYMAETVSRSTLSPFASVPGPLATKSAHAITTTTPSTAGSATAKAGPGPRGESGGGTAAGGDDGGSAPSGDFAFGGSARSQTRNVAAPAPFAGSAAIPPLAIALIGVGVAVFIAARFLRNDRL